MSAENVKIKPGTKLPGKVLDAMPSLWQTKFINVSNHFNDIAEGDDPDTSRIVALGQRLADLWRVAKINCLNPRIAEFVCFVLHSAVHFTLDIMDQAGAAMRRRTCKSVVNALWRIMDTEIKEFDE